MRDLRSGKRVGNSNSPLLCPTLKVPISRLCACGVSKKKKNLQKFCSNMRDLRSGKRVGNSNSPLLCPTLKVPISRLCACGVSKKKKNSYNFASPLIYLMICLIQIKDMPCQILSRPKTQPPQSPAPRSLCATINFLHLSSLARSSAPLSSARQIWAREQGACKRS